MLPTNLQKPTRIINTQYPILLSDWEMQQYQLAEAVNFHRLRMGSIANVTLPSDEQRVFFASESSQHPHLNIRFCNIVNVRLEVVGTLENTCLPGEDEYWDFDYFITVEAAQKILNCVREVRVAYLDGAMYVLTREQFPESMAHLFGDGDCDGDEPIIEKTEASETELIPEPA